MAKRSSRILEVREKTEVNCMWGLLGILQSCQGLTSPKLISNGRPVSRHVIEHSRKADQQLASFDEECRKVHNVDVARVAFDGSTGRMIVKGLQNGKMDPTVGDDLVNAGKSGRKKRGKLYQSYSSCSKNTSDEISLNRLTLAALLEAVSAQDNPEEDLNSECFQRSLSLGKYDPDDPINMQQVKIDRELFRKQRPTKSESDSKSFSNAMEVLNSKKDGFMDLLPEPDSLLSRGSKNFRPSRTERETIKSLLDAKLAEYKRENVRTSRKLGNLWKKIDYQCSRGTNNIVVLEPVPQSVKNREYVTCHCSSVQFSRMILDAKPSSFTFRETKKKLKHAFGSPKKEPNRCSVNSESTQEVGDDCIYCGAGGRSSFSSSTKELKLDRDSDVAAKNLDLSGANFCKKEVSGVILEAKIHLLERFKKINDGAVRDEKSARTLRRVLASPEHEFLSSPRRESQYCLDSARMMRVSPYYSSEIPNGRDTACLSPLRPNTMILTPDESNDEARIAETSGVLEPESNVINAKDVITPMQIADTTKLLDKDDDIDSRLSIYELDVADSIKYQEEHQSPVSVLEPFFTEDANSPQSTTLQTAQQRLQPRRLDFEEHSIESFSISCTEEQDHLSEYVYSVLQVSFLDWDQLSKIELIPEMLLHESVFYEVECLPTDCCFDPKLLFDHINEVLIDIHSSHFCSCPSPSSVTPKTMSVPLEKLVLDKIMTQADFYLLPCTEKRTLDQLVSKDIKNSRSWLDLRFDIEQIAVDISEKFLEECILGTLLDSVT